ncbi:permease prefix domain 1-containing protein [Bacillus massiliigorillae]|uniref:permease prefix domain 1-containing protein n=1 Tax=Bacillus massiliigorillae TaxID=1243664 RepID=UPI0003AB24C8|nr:permease prefix domain 1-containing protein [Bacillus massiliigorillae]
MKRITQFVDSIYKNVRGNTIEIKELKEEMKIHLIETVETLKAEGKTEEEAIMIALNNFGEEEQLNKGLSEFFYVPKKFMKYLLSVSCIAFLVASYIIISTLYSDYQFKQNFKENKASITKDILHIVKDSKELTNNQLQQIQSVFNEHSDQLQHIALFNVDENKNVAAWVKQNPNIKQEATTTYPLNYQYATNAFDSKSLTSMSNVPTHDGYDLGTVAESNDNWVVQYQFSPEYRDIIEMNNTLLIKDYRIAFQIPFILYTVFGVIIAIWISFRFPGKPIAIQKNVSVLK